VRRPLVGAYEVTVAALLEPADHAGVGEFRAVEVAAHARWRGSRHRHRVVRCAPAFTLFGVALQALPVVGPRDRRTRCCRGHGCLGNPLGAAIVADSGPVAAVSGARWSTHQ